MALAHIRGISATVFLAGAVCTTAEWLGVNAPTWLSGAMFGAGLMACVTDVILGEANEKLATAVKYIIRARMIDEEVEKFVQEVNDARR